MLAKRPQPKGGSRLGRPNKVASDVREMIHEAFVLAGGVGYLVKQADANPKAFMSLLGKVVPSEIHATIKRDITELTREELYAIVNGGNAKVIDAEPIDVTPLADRAIR